MSKKKNNKSNSEKYLEWLYMNDKEVTVIDINNAVKNEVNLEIDVWEQLDIASINLHEKASIDIVEIENDLGDEESNKFIDDNNIKRIFTVKMPEDSFEEAKNIMNIIVNNIGGFFCEDNDDFSPMIK